MRNIVSYGEIKHLRPHACLPAENTKSSDIETLCTGLHGHECRDKAPCHLIASSFDGPGLRYNLVPMRGRQINQGLMKRVENGARACLEGDASVTDYRVRLHYPDRIDITMSIKGPGGSR